MYHHHNRQTLQQPLSMSSGTAPGSSPPKLSELGFESDLLHLIFHCNKNAHRCNGWWKWLGILRRNIGKLLDPAHASGMQARLEYMRSIVVPSCYRAFTSLIAGAHQVPLGLTLLAVLARVHKIIRVGRRGKEEEAEEVVADEEMVAETREGVKINGTDLVVGPVTMEDFGETIRREGGEEEEREREEEENAVVPEKKEEVVVAAKESELVAQEMTATGRVLLGRKRKHQEGTSKDSITKTVKKDEEKVTKKRKRRKEVASPPPPPSPSPPPPPPPLRPPSPPAVKGLTIIKDKQKSRDKEGAKKKKKRKKGDEIDDLFAGLL